MFVQFGTSHLAALVAAFGSGLALAAVARKWQDVGTVRLIRTALAALMITTWAAWIILVTIRSWASIAALLPMHLCDWTTVVVVATLTTNSQRSYELAYFWTFGGTAQALLTPDLSADFPDPRYLIFFGLHGAAIASMLFLTLGLRMRPQLSGIPHVALWSFVYLAAAFSVDELFGTNFGYLMGKPAHPSLLDAMAPWPYYIIELVLLGAVFMALLYAPFLAADWLSKKEQPHRG